LVAHGLEVRLGLTSERFGGRVAGCCRHTGAAHWPPDCRHSSWGMLCGSPTPSLPQPPSHFGPESSTTFGPVVYAIWISGRSWIPVVAAKASNVSPRSACSSHWRRSPSACFSSPAPILAMMVVLMGFGLPCMLAPIAIASDQRSSWANQFRSCLCFIVVWWFGGGRWEEWARGHLPFN